MKVAARHAKDTAGQTGLSRDENIASFFQPDVLLAADYFENFRRKSPLEPEKTLMLAVLEDGIRCYQDNISAQGGKKRRLFQEAEEWFLSDDCDWLFSFASTCAELGIDPGYIRRGLKQWKKRAENMSRRKQRRSATAQQRLVA